MAKAKKMQIKKREKAVTATYLYLFLLPMFLSTILSLFSKDYSRFLLKLLSFFMLMGAIKLIDMGLESEKEYNRATIALAPKTKFKLYGTIGATITLFFLCYVVDHFSLLNSLFTAAIGAFGLFAYYGPDPVKNKFMVVYLDGVKDVIHRYNSIEKESLDSSFRQRLIELLHEASERFDKELDRLKSNEVFNLDVQIDALKQQLKN